MRYKLCLGRLKALIGLIKFFIYILFSFESVSIGKCIEYFPQHSEFTFTLVDTTLKLTILMFPQSRLLCGRVDGYKLYLEKQRSVRRNRTAATFTICEIRWDIEFIYRARLHQL